ncbi:uncharacterized protein LOC143882056 [Tasmannia lanceolata]|uniref:uncharacterized protein LOC143882056 n=1 Tax=Tasmannia lanceolata TaxID=3420 RepID=UPI004062C757
MGCVYGLREILRNWSVIIRERKIVQKVTPKWTAPPEGWMKLNFDGSALDNPGIAEIGGIIRDTRGITIMSYSGPAGSCDANEAEARALLFGLKWYNLNSSAPLIIEGDSTNVVAWAIGKSKGPWRLQDILAEIRDLVREVHPQIEHRRRTANEAADKLAKEGAMLESTRIWVRALDAGIGCE